VFATNGTTVMTTTKVHDFLNRLTNIQSSVGGSAIASFKYAYNSANQRTSVTNVDTARWVYTYDSLGQVISGKKYWSDGTAVAGQHFEYAFDTIGNRQSTKAGGDNDGVNLQSATYAVNTLNQYTNRTVPGYVNVLGTASNNATVTIWAETSLYAPTIRKGEYFRGELPVNNSTGAMWLTITNVAVLNNGTNADIVTNMVGNVLLARTPEVFKYDTDGNLTSDSLWTNLWNVENRRTPIESTTGVPSAGRMKEQWTHLADGRWIERIVSTWNGSAYVSSYTNRYVWDAQVLLAVLDHTNGLVMSFMRGLDMSGSLQGAGGVGGVLAATFKTNGTHFFCYDGNGNVTALVSATSGSESARYEYGPFAEPIRMTGPLAKLNPIRFSTQYADDVTGDVKYLFRDYDSDSGRWLSRDPVAEFGGINVYAFIGNEAVDAIDVLGLFPATVEIIEIAEGSHGSAEYNGTHKQYVDVTAAIERGDIPLNATHPKPAASITVRLDEGFNAEFRAWTLLSRDSSLTSLQLSTDLKGVLKVCCPCPFKKVRANWSATAALTGTAGLAQAYFDNERGATTSWNRPNVTRSGAKEKDLDTASYCTTFTFLLGQAWTDVSRTTPTVSTGRVHASFVCID
jgi:RHS repeat-associated protein